MTSLIRLFLTKITNLSQRHEHLCLTNFQVGIECCVRNTKKQLTIIHFICFTRVCKKGGALQYNHYVLLCIKIWWIDTILYSLLKWGFIRQPLIMLNILNLWQYADLPIHTWISYYNIYLYFHHTFRWFRLNSVNSKFYMLLHLMVWTFCNATIYFHSHVWSKKVPLMHYLIHTLRENAVEALFNPYATCLNQTFDDETDTSTIFYKFL